MCGICGKVDFGGRTVDRALIHRMCETIVHRGPDDEGIYTAPYVGLGERRLAIIDLRHEAAPPLPNEDETVWIVFNGEIYNFQALRPELEARGHRFRTNADTEVVLHGYEEYGTDCLSHLNGMFAFAIWDSRRKLLFAARDRMGEKPFYYTKTASSFVFGSEIKAITADPGVTREPNLAAIDRYLTLQAVPAPLTAFANIFKLPAAHFLTCDATGQVDVRRYWEPPLPAPNHMDEQETEAEILRLLEKSVRQRLIADVPVGTLLSGGIDSGTIVALASRYRSKPLTTFSVAFDNSPDDELEYARMVAERYGTDHHEFRVQPDVVSVLPDLIHFYNEPFADSSAIPTYYISKMARQRVTVALSGDGGDENFGGYEHYRLTLEWNGVDVIPLPVRRALASATTAVLDRLPYSRPGAVTSRAMRMIGSTLPDRYALQTAIFKPEEKIACYTSSFRARLNGNSNQREIFPDGADQMNWMMNHDQGHYLPDCLTVKTDVAAMANSLELRAPFLDHELVEFSASIPSSMKRSGTRGKIVLRNAVKDLLPERVATKRKTGFTAPISVWMGSVLLDTLNANLLDETAARRGLFRQDFVRRMIDENAIGKRDWSARLWALLCLEMWFREFID